MEAGVPGYVVISWFGIMLPAGAPRELITRLNSELAQVMRAPDIRERLATDGAEPNDAPACSRAPVISAMVDIKDPSKPRLVSVSDKNWGVFILRYTGPGEPAPTAK